MSITNTIRNLRERAGLTQESMAERLETTRSNYAYLESRGEKLTIDQIQSIAKALGVPVVEILVSVENFENESNSRIEELERRVKELEEFNRIYHQRDKLYSEFVEHILSKINVTLLEIADANKVINEKDYEFEELYEYKFSKAHSIYWSDYNKYNLVEKIQHLNDWKLYLYPNGKSLVSRYMDENQIRKSINLLFKKDNVSTILLMRLAYMGLLDDESLKNAVIK